MIPSAVYKIQTTELRDPCARCVHSGATPAITLGSSAWKRSLSPKVRLGAAEREDSGGSKAEQERKLQMRIPVGLGHSRDQFLPESGCHSLRQACTAASTILAWQTPVSSPSQLRVPGTPALALCKVASQPEPRASTQQTAAAG